MAKRLTKITTRTGDDGSTGLGDGTRIAKHDIRIQTIGAIDELNSMLGLLLCEPLPSDVRNGLLHIQHDLFDLGGELCIPGHTMLRDQHVAQLDAWLEHYNPQLPHLQEFILPGGSRAASLAHVARTICRRAECQITQLAGSASVHQTVCRYVNRLSDLLFVWARILNRYAGRDDVLWQRSRSS